jgi:excisionase family DNA binding protein
MEQDSIMTSAEVASYLRVHRKTIYKLLKSKELFGFRVGSDWRFYRDVIDQWRIEREQPVKTERYAAPDFSRFCYSNKTRSIRSLPR